MADDQNQQQPAADKAEEAAEEAKDSAGEAQKAEEKAEKAADEAQDSAQVAEKAEAKVEKAAEEVKEAAKSEPRPEERAKVEEKKEAPKPMPKVSKKLEDLISEIEKLSVLELSELVKALEVKFGVTAAVPVAQAAAGGAAVGVDEGASEQTTFNVVLSDGGANKISVIKAVREIVPTLGLKEAKDLVDAAPKPVLEGANKESAAEAKTKLEAAGAKVELK